MQQKQSGVRGAQNDMGNGRVGVGGCEEKAATGDAHGARQQATRVGYMPRDPAQSNEMVVNI